MSDYPTNVKLPIPTGVYNNTDKYNFSAQLFQDHNYSITNGYQLNPQDIQLVEIRNSINKLFLTAEMTYVDTIGIIANYIDIPVVVCLITFYQIPQEHDGTFSAEFDPCQVNSATSFSHRFIVNKIEVDSRKDDAITYKFQLVSENWYKCIATLDYSNHDRDPEPLGKIMQSCFGSVGLSLVSKNIDRIFTTKLNYCTAANSNLMRTLDYLLSMSFYYANDDYDQSLKFIWYDPETDTYKITDLSDPTTYNPTTYSTAMSMFKGGEESLLAFLPGDIATVDDYVPRTSQIQAMFDSHFFHHDISATNDIKEQGTEISKSVSRTTIYTANGIVDSIKQSYMTVRRILDSVDKLTDIDPSSKLNYISRSSYDQNDLNVYDDHFQMFTRTNSIRLLTDGQLSRKPSSIFTVTVPKDWNDVKSDNPDIYNEWRSRYMSFEGPYMITEVVTLISPALQIFRQNLRLSRNYLPVSTLIK